MAAPTDSARVATNITSAGTTHAINVGSPVAGTLLIVFVRFAVDPGTVTFTGYNLLAGPDTSDAAAGDSTAIYWRWADGAEGATDTLTTANSTKMAAICWEVTGAANEAPAISTVAIGTTGANTADPTSVAPTGPPQDTLYIAMAAGDGEVGAYTAAPTNYTSPGLIAANSGTGGLPATNVLMGGASRQITGSSSADPGNFTHGAHAAGWTAWAIAIRPPQPTVYEETGSLIGGAVAAGADAFTASETGSLVAGSTLAGSSVKEGPPETPATWAFSYYDRGELHRGMQSSADGYGFEYWRRAELLASLGEEVAAAGGITYEKAGALTPDTTLAGSDVFEASELGALTPDTSLSGADSFTAAETGSLTPDTTLAGTDSFQPAETGSLTAGAVLAGADVFTAAEAGSLTPDTTLAGADVFTAAETGSLTPDTTVSGADAATLNRLGALTTLALLSGADVFTAAETGSLTTQGLLSGTATKAVGGITYEKAGSLTAGASLSGADVFTAAELGSLTAGASLTGADVFTAAETGALTPDTTVVGADVFEASETGSLTPDTTVSGLDSFQAAETGALTPDTSLSGLDAFTAAETGTLMAFAFLAGVGQKSGTITKTGSLFATGLLAGADASTFNRLGSLTPDTTVSGGRIREKTKAGDLLALARASGLDAFTATETGTLSPAARLLGGRVIIANRTGALLTATFLSGVYSQVPGLTILGVIITGQIGHGFSGRMDEAATSGQIDSGDIGRIEKADRGFVGAPVGGDIPE